jgi:hypothetical protein
VTGALNDWNNQIEGPIDSGFGLLARLDFRNTPASDEPWKSLPREKFLTEAEQAIGRAAAYLNCINAIEANLRQRDGL